MAGNTPGIPRAQAVASTAIVAYLGFLVGPLVLGTIGDVVSLRFAIALTVLGVQFFAHSLRPKSLLSPIADFRSIPGTVTAEPPVS
ncbi:MAG: hypothetical protein WKF81_04035 [Thermomicrobiales bacterium]